METLNKIKRLGVAIVNNLISLLLLFGLTLVNVACYLQWGLVTGLIVTGITLIIVSTILMIEQNKQEQPPQK